MTKADTLSRQYDYDNGHSNNYEVQLLKDEWFKARVLVLTSRTEVEDWVRNANEGLKTRTDGRLIIPRELVEGLLREYYDSPLTGHLGQAKTWKALARCYWCMDMLKDV